MKKVFALYTFCCFLADIKTIAQGRMDDLLKQLEQNNKSLQSNKKYWEARKAEYSTGLTLNDPQVEYDYLFGSPLGAGNQKEFSATQRLDFPTAYKRKRILSKEQIAQADLQQDVYRQDILLKAKLVALELIYLNRKASVLHRRLTEAEELAKAYQTKLEKGDIIILDVNKAKLQLLNIRNEAALNDNEIQFNQTRLTELNGGVEIVIKDTLYPPGLTIPDFEILDSLIEANDPIIKVYEKETAIQEDKIMVQKALNLPKIETGYHSQGILGQTYRGFHAGISIPLWENRNRLKAAKANLDHATSNTETHRLQHRLENKRLYDQLEIRRNAMEQYFSLVNSLNNKVLLDKALQFGQITIIQYLQDQAFYYSAYDDYLQLERDYHKAVAELYKFTL